MLRISRTWHFWSDKYCQATKSKRIGTLLFNTGADAAKNLTVAKQTKRFKDVVEEQSMFLRRGFLVLCRAA